MGNKVRLGIIGVGGIVHHHMRSLLEIPEVEIAALADVDRGQIEKRLDAYPQLRSTRIFDDYRELLSEPGLDAVIIATPHTLHFEQVMAALDKGLHVLTEKPMVCRVDHAKELIRRSEEVGKTLMIAYQRHYDPMFRYIKQCVDEGKLGEITVVSTLLCQEWKRGTAGTWRQDPALSGGGQLNDSGSHQIDVILWATGLAASSVYAVIDNLGCAVDINSALTIKFTNGAQGTVSVAGDAPSWYEDFSIIGTKAAMYYRNGKLSFCNEKGEISEVGELPQTGTIVKGFIDCILGRDENWVPPICGLRVIELTQAAWESARTGLPCQVGK